MDQEKTGGKKDERKIRLMLFLCSFTTFYWIAGNIFNVYSFALASVIFEILWLPMLLLLFGLPVLFFILWAREKFKLRSVYLLLFINLVALILILKLYK